MEFAKLFECISKNALWDEVGLLILGLAAVAAITYGVICSAKYVGDKKKKGYKLGWVATTATDAKPSKGIPNWVWVAVGVVFGVAACLVILF